MDLEVHFLATFDAASAVELVASWHEPRSSRFVVVLLRRQGDKIPGSRRPLRSEAVFLVVGFTACDRIDGENEQAGWAKQVAHFPQDRPAFIAIREQSD